MRESNALTDTSHSQAEREVEATLNGLASNLASGINLEAADGDKDNAPAQPAAGAQH